MFHSSLSQFKCRTKVRGRYHLDLVRNLFRLVSLLTWRKRDRESLRLFDSLNVTVAFVLCADGSPLHAAGALGNLSLSGLSLTPLDPNTADYRTKKSDT